MRSKKLLKEEKELSLEVLESGPHAFKNLEFPEILKLVKKFKLHKKKTIVSIPTSKPESGLF